MTSPEKPRTVAIESRWSIDTLDAEGFDKLLAEGQPEIEEMMRDRVRQERPGEWILLPPKERHYSPEIMQTLRDMLDGKSKRMEGIGLENPRWLTGRKDIAEYLGVTGRSVTRLWKKYRDFPVKVVDGKFSASTADLDAWMRKRSHTCGRCGQEVTNPL